MAMRFEPFWLATAPRFAGSAQGSVTGAYDVAVVGGGFTGLSAARRLAMEGATVVVLEADRVAGAASGRNGGHLNNGLAHSYLAAKAHVGEARAKALYRMFDDSIDTIESIIAVEGIDCAFRRAGKLKLASRPGHVAALRANFEAVHREVDPDTAFLTRDALRNEIVSQHFHGAMLSKKSAMMHVGRFGAGLAAAAVRRGAAIFENAPVTAMRVKNGRRILTTPRGDVSARETLIATGATTTANFAWFRRRIAPVGSYIIATRPLSQDEIAVCTPGRRTYVNTLNIGAHFRLSPDDRLIFGGRARFSATSDQRAEARAGAILRATLAATFPQLASVDIDYCWGGLVDMTRDRLPRAGRHDGLWYAMGYSGHGAQLSPHLGAIMADVILGKECRNPLDGLDWPPVPGHLALPWLMPLVGFYYRMKDAMS